jgi:hypothetical protein
MQVVHAAPRHQRRKARRIVHELVDAASPSVVAVVDVPALRVVMLSETAIVAPVQEPGSRQPKSSKLTSTCT